MDNPFPSKKQYADLKKKLKGRMKSAPQALKTLRLEFYEALNAENTMMSQQGKSMVFKEIIGEFLDELANNNSTPDASASD